MKPFADASSTQLPAGGPLISSSSGESNGAEAYWFAVHLRVTVWDGDRSRTQLVRRPLAIFGSHPQCDVVLSDSAVPKRCYCILANDRGLYGASLIPRSARERRGFRRVTVGRSIRIGRYRLRIELTSASDGDVLSCAAKSGSHAAAGGLEWVDSGVRHHVQLRGQRPLLLGRQAPSQVAINDPAVSVVHCLVYPQQGRLWVVDLCSSNGTWVRRCRRQVQELLEGRSFKLGATRFHWLRPAASSWPSLESAKSAEADAACQDALRDELNGLKTTLLNLQAELQTLRAERERVCQEAGDLDQRRAVLERDEMVWQAWYEAEETRLSRWATALHTQQQQAARDRELWDQQRAAELDQSEMAIRQRSEHIEALQASLKQQQEHWESEHQRQSRRLAAEQEQLAAERCEIAKERIALQQSARKLQAERQHQVETITRIRSELVKMKSRLATMQQERERWLVQRIRTQRALSVREQNAVAAEQQLAHRDAQLSAWEAQLRRQQQELTEQRRRDLEVAPASAPPGHPALDAVCECTRWHVGINGRLKSPENCLSAPNFFELLDRALREKDRSG